MDSESTRDVDETGASGCITHPKDTPEANLRIQEVGKEKQTTSR